MDINIFDKFDPKIQRGARENCQLCKKSFSIFTRQHQCKRCFRAVCDDCGTKKKTVYKQGMTTRDHRLCDICAKQSEYLEEHVKQNKLVFGQSTEIGIKWNKRISKKNTLPYLQSGSSKNSGKFTKDAFSGLWDSYNYSFRQLIGLLTYQMKQDQVYQQIKNVYQQILKFYPDQKMDNIIYLIIFILCYCNQQHTINICLYLLQLKKTIPDGRQLVNIYLKALGITDDEINKISDYIKYRIKKFINNFSINLVTAESSISTLSRVLEKKKIDQLYMLFTLVIDQNKDYLIAKKSNKAECDLLIIKNCNMERISNKYRILGPIKVQTLTTSYQSANKNEIDDEPDHRKSDIPIFNNNNNLFAPDLKDLLLEKQTSIQNNFKKKQQKVDEKSISSFSTSSINLNPRRQQLYKNYSLPQQCTQCQKYQQKINTLQKIIDQKNMEIQNLQIRIRLEMHSNGNQNLPQNDNYQRKYMLLQQQYDKIRNGQNQKYKNYQKDIKNLQMELQKYKKQLKNLQKVKQENLSIRVQNDQLNLTIKMLKNKLQSATLFSSGPKDDGQVKKINQMLRASLLQKNQQLQNQSKQNKLLVYQLQSYTKNNNEDSKRQLEKLKKTNQQLMKKISQISDLVVKQQSEKIRLSEIVFEMKENKKDNNVAVQQKSQCSLF